MKIKFLYFLLITIISLSNIGCNILESDNSLTITGKWIHDSPFESPPKITQRLEYTFNSDNTFNTETFVIDSLGNILGYRFASNGIYSVFGNRLSIVTPEFLGINLEPAPLYVPKSDLKILQVYSESLKIKFNIRNNEMIWIYPPCPPDANCIATRVFVRNVSF